MDNQSNALEHNAHRDVPAHHDEFNRKELYQGASEVRSTAQKNSSIVTERPGVHGHHLDFASAGDIYAPKGVNTMNGMLGDKARVERIGLSGTSSQSQNDSTAAPSDASKKPEDKGAEKFDDTDGSAKPVPKDGIVRPGVDLPGREYTPDDMRRMKDRQGPRDENGNFSPEKPQQVQEKPSDAGSGKLGDRIVSSQENGKPSEVSSFDAKNNTLTNYSFGADGHVDGRTVTDLNKNTVDSIKYDENSMPVSHKVSNDGKPAQDAPIDNKTPRVFNTLNPDGSLKSLEENAPGSQTRINVDSNTQALSKDVDTFRPDGSSSQVHQDFDGYGKAKAAKTTNLDKDGKLKETITESPYSTTIDKYGANNKLVESAEHSEGRDSLTRFTDKGKATAARTSDGSRELDIQNNDGSRQKYVSNPSLHMSGSYERTVDGSTHQITDDATGHTETVVDGKSGVWARSNRNKGGLIEKSWGQSGKVFETFSERQL